MNTTKKKETSVRPASYYRIMNATGRKPTNCKCQKCKQQCHTPCLGTPQDIERLIESGYADRLAVTVWGAGMIMGVINRPVYMVQAKAGEEWCTFFQNGLCELHDLGLKPTEGRLSSHAIKIENFKPKKSISWNVAKEWLDSKNKDVVMRIFNKMIEI